MTFSLTVWMFLLFCFALFFLMFPLNNWVSHLVVSIAPYFVCHLLREKLAIEERLKAGKTMCVKLAEKFIFFFLQ